MIQSFKMAIKSIASNKTRAFLTMLGIIIGVMALVILVSLVSGATNTVTDTISGLGTDSLSVSVSDDKGVPVMLSDLDTWMQEEEFAGIAPAISESMTGKYGSTTGSITVYGTTGNNLKVEQLNLQLGRFLKHADVDNESYVCVISETAADEMIGYQDCLGCELILGGIGFTVVGVLKDDEESFTGMMSSGSKAAYIPYSTMLRISDSQTEEISSFYVLPADGVSMDTAVEKMTAILNERFEEDEDAYSVSSSSLLEDTMGSISSIFETLLGGIAAISLIVGGIGIMNIMLVTVTERTREIGIRKAVGASRGAILMQFLVEAVVLCMFGCGIGIGCSALIIRVINMVVSGLSMKFTMNGTVVLISVLFCFAIGVCFGLYPANKAAKMKPIDALHFGG